MRQTSYSSLDLFDPKLQQIVLRKIMKSKFNFKPILSLLYKDRNRDRAHRITQQQNQLVLVDGWHLLFVEFAGCGELGGVSSSLTLSLSQ
jgi:uridine kinase